MEGRRPVEKEAEAGVMLPPAQERQHYQMLGESLEGILPWSLQRERGPVTH